MGTRPRDIDATLVNKPKSKNKFSIETSTSSVYFTIVSNSELKAMKPSFIDCIFP